MEPRRGFCRSQDSGPPTHALGLDNTWAGCAPLALDSPWLELHLPLPLRLWVGVPEHPWHFQVRPGDKGTADTHSSQWDCVVAWRGPPAAVTPGRKKKAPRASYGLSEPPRAQVFQAWYPVLQCQEVGPHGRCAGSSFTSGLMLLSQEWVDYPKQVCSKSKCVFLSQ